MSISYKHSTIRQKPYLPPPRVSICLSVSSLNEYFIYCRYRDLVLALSGCLNQEKGQSDEGHIESVAHGTKSHAEYTRPESIREWHMRCRSHRVGVAWHVNCTRLENGNTALLTTPIECAVLGQTNQW